MVVGDTEHPVVRGQMSLLPKCLLQLLRLPMDSAVAVLAPLNPAEIWHHRTGL